MAPHPGGTLTEISAAARSIGEFVIFGTPKSGNEEPMNDNASFMSAEFRRFMTDAPDHARAWMSAVLVAA
jgi:hypothetical protein